MKIFLFPFLALFLAAFTRFYSPVVAPISPGCATATVAKPAGAASNLLFQSTDGGAHWQDISSGLPDNFEIGCATVQGGEVLLGGNRGWVLRSTDPASGIWQQTNVGGFLASGLATFTALSSQQHQSDSVFVGNDLASTVVSLYSGPSGLYACMAMGGCYKQISGTSLWYPIHKTLMGSLVETPSGTLVAATRNGIHTSADGGGTWNTVYHKGWASDLRIEGSLLLAEGEHGPLQSADGGVTWTLAPVQEPLCLEPGKPVFDQAQVGYTRFCSHEGGISCSTNNGKSWKLVRSMAGMDKNTRFELMVLGQTVFAVRMQAGC